MLRILRRLGIAIGSLVMASLVMALVGGMLLPLVGGGYQVFSGSSAPNAIATFVTVLLGGLIYRDIIRREAQAA